MMMHGLTNPKPGTCLALSVDDAAPYSTHRKQSFLESK